MKSWRLYWQNQTERIRHDTPEYQQNIEPSYCSVGDLCQHLHLLSVHACIDRIALQPALIVDETVKLIRSTIPTTVQLDVQIDESLHAVRIEADASRLQEALINLCNNAVQAMDESGFLTIRMSNVILEDSDIPARYDCIPGEFVQLVVEDDGCGMSQSIIDKIFDPFFTTKSVIRHWNGACHGTGYSRAA